MSQELTRKDMKGPDRFQATGVQAAGWMARHRRTVFGLLGAAGAVVVASVAVSALQGRRAETAGAALSAVAAAMQGEISTVPLPGASGPFYPSEEARQRAVLEAAQRVAAEFPGTAAGHTAALAAADARFKLGEWDAALAGYQAYVAEAGEGDSLLFGALEGIALVEEAKGNPEAAVLAYERLAREVPAQAARADLERARLLARSGKADEARALLASFPEKHGDSPLVAEAAERLARLGTP
jgi:tetratricopeptide (TPR) repeat protein